MSLDKEMQEYLHKHYDERLSQVRREAQEEYRKHMAQAKANSVTPLTKDNLEELEKQFWTKKQMEIEADKKTLGAEFYSDYGGSREAANELFTQYDKEQASEANKKQLTQSQMQKDSEQQKEQEKQRRELEAKKKKENRQKAEEHVPKQNELQAQKQEAALKKDRLREEFNRASEGRGR